MTPKMTAGQTIDFLDQQLEDAINESELSYGGNTAADILRIAQTIAEANDVECRMTDEGNIEWYWEG